MDEQASFVMTAAGQRLAWQNNNNGGLSLNLTHAQFGSGKKLPTGNETALISPKEAKKFGTVQNVGSQKNIAFVLEKSNLNYEITEIGLWSGDPGVVGSTLVMYASKTSGVFGYRFPDAQLTLKVALSWSSMPGNVNIVQDTEFNALAIVAAHDDDQIGAHGGAIADSNIAATLALERVRLAQEYSEQAKEELDVKVVQAKSEALMVSGLELSEHDQNQNAAHGGDFLSLYAASLFAMEQAALANKAANDLKKKNNQQLVLSIKNRGVVSGCVVTKSTTAARNLSISSGICFANGRKYNVIASDNIVSVPENTTSGSFTVYAYLVFDALIGSYKMQLTQPSTLVPDNAIKIFSIIVPANSTSLNDQYLSSVSLVDVRRIEPYFPMFFESAPAVSVEITRLDDTNYSVAFDCVGSTGFFQKEGVVVSSRATNGFVVTYSGEADDVTLICSVSKLNQS